MARMQSVFSGYIVFAVVLCTAGTGGAAYAQDAHAPVDPFAAFEDGQRLSEAALLDLLSGSTLYGTYTDERPDWAEQTAVTGQVFDVARDWLEVGQWATADDVVCYSYFLPSGGLAPGTSCFDVYEYGGDYYFYSTGTDYLVGYTTRVDRPSLM